MASSWSPELESASMPRIRRHAVPTVRNDATIAVSPEALQPAPPLYEAGSQARRTLGWRAPTTSPNHAVLSHLTALRDRSRAAVRNDGFAKAIIDALVSNIVGTGIVPLSQIPDRTLRKQVHELWLRWTDKASNDGILDFYGVQSLATRGCLEGGEMFVRMRRRLASDGLPVPLQLELLEPELCPHDFSTRLESGRKVHAGIEYDAIGRRSAYWFHPSRPDDEYGMEYYRKVRVPADLVVHLYEPLRAGQSRGVPRLTQSLIRLLETDKMDDAVLLRQQLSNMLVGFVKKSAPTVDTVPVNPITGLAETPASLAEERPMLAMEPGLLQELAPGEDIEFSDPPDVGQSYKDFVRQQLVAACTSAGAPYEVVSGDMGGLNDRVVRVILQEFRRRIRAWQHQVIAFQLCRAVWREWMDQAFLSSALALPSSYPMNPDPWLAVKWVPEAFAYIHPVQDVEAATKEIAAGLASRSAKVSERGDDAEQIDEEQAADNERADRLGLVYASDGRQVLAKSGATEPADAEAE